MFYGTFLGCTSLTTVQAGWNGHFDGAAAENMYNSTFDSCSSLDNIPQTLFTGPGGKFGPYVR